MAAERRLHGEPAGPRLVGVARAGLTAVILGSAAVALAAQADWASLLT